MRSTRMAVCVMLMLALLPIAYARSKAKSPGARTLRAAIEAANARFTKAFERGDAGALAAMYTPDAIAFPPDSEMIRGNEAIGQFWKATHDHAIKSAVLTTLDVGRSGNLAYEVGTASLALRQAGTQGATAAVKYVVVWKRQGDGSWKLHRDIWNSLPARR